MINLTKDQVSVNASYSACKSANFDNFVAWRMEMNRLGFTGTFYLGGSVALRDVYGVYPADHVCHDFDVVYVPKNKEQYATDKRMFACLMATSRKDPNYDTCVYGRADFQLVDFPKANVWIQEEPPQKYVVYMGEFVETLNTILQEKVKCGRIKDRRDFLTMSNYILLLGGECKI